MALHPSLFLFHSSNSCSHIRHCSCILPTPNFNWRILSRLVWSPQLCYFAEPALSVMFPALNQPRVQMCSYCFSVSAFYSSITLLLKKKKKNKKDNKIRIFVKSWYMWACLWNCIVWLVSWCPLSSCGDSCESSLNLIVLFTPEVVSSSLLLFLFLIFKSWISFLCSFMLSFQAISNSVLVTL